MTGVWDWDVRTNHLDWDEKMYEIYGIPNGQPVNYETWKKAVVPEDFPATEAILQRVIAEKVQGTAEFRITTPDGSVRHVQAAEGPVVDRDGRVVRVVGVNTDITKRKQMEIDLHEKNVELQHAAQAKNSFLANMSHELRTPLNGIIGFSELLVDGLPGEVNAEQKEYLEDILNSSQHLLQLINDVLDLAKVEAGKMELHPEPFSLRRAIMQVCSVAQPLVQKKKIEVNTTFTSELDEVTLDEQKLKQILYNLISNAIKFTDEHGRVEIKIALHEVNHFTIAVRDTGIGIKSENIKRLFKEFEQLDEGTTRRYQGTGLGLALTRKIVEMQGGTIKVESEYGKGSTFTVTLPLVTEEIAS
jgi:PAS domain S-box-containing protein